MPLQFTYFERCHYNSFEPSNMPFYTYLILLDPRAGSGIFVWTKMPLLPLHSPLTYLWAPHVSIFFIFPFFPSRCRRPPPPGPSAHPPALCACRGRIVGGGEDGGHRSGAGAGESARLAREVALQRRRSVRAPSAAQASPEAAPFGVHARAPPRRSGSAP